MKSLFIGLGIFISIVLIVGLIYIAWMIWSFVFVGQNTERQIRKLDDYTLLLDAQDVSAGAVKNRRVSVEEVPYRINDGRPPEPYIRFRTEAPYGQWLLMDDGRVVAGQRVFDQDPGKDVVRLPLPAAENVKATEQRQQELWLSIEQRLDAAEASDSDDPQPDNAPDLPARALIFNGSQVLLEEHGKALQVLGQLTDRVSGAALNLGVAFAGWLNDEQFVVGGYQHTDKGTFTPLYQIEVSGLNAWLSSHKPDEISAKKENPLSGLAESPEATEPSDVAESAKVTDKGDSNNTSPVSEADTQLLFAARHIATDSYYLHEKLPDIYWFDDLNVRVMVYFVGSLSWGFGGDVNRPKYSVVRVYSDDYPYGQDIASFSFAAGMIRDVSAVMTPAGQLQLTLLGDVRRPSGATEETSENSDQAQSAEESANGQKAERTSQAIRQWQIRL